MSSGQQTELALGRELTANVLAAACSSRTAFEAVTGKWASLVLLALFEGPHRFGELRRAVQGVSDKMLAQTLHSLEREGMVARADQSDAPHGGYWLTPLGADIAGRLRGLADTLQTAVPQLNAARARYDA
ncbi:MAG: winged helix-turn-helix transcriptional regulator [Arachnia sp.]